MNQESTLEFCYLFMFGGQLRQIIRRTWYASYAAAAAYLGFILLGRVGRRFRGDRTWWRRGGRWLLHLGGDRMEVQRSERAVVLEEGPTNRGGSGPDCSPIPVGYPRLWVLLCPSRSVT